MRHADRLATARGLSEIDVSCLFEVAAFWLTHDLSAGRSDWARRLFKLCSPECISAKPELEEESWGQETRILAPAFAILRAVHDSPLTEEGDLPYLFGLS